MANDSGATPDVAAGGVGDEDTAGPYEMTISLNVLNHLGLNLYSNVPAVLSEVVANSYDADATIVRVEIDPDSGVVEITDDGHGMTLEEVNSRFLTVGFTRRTRGLAYSPGGRAVMGRKGIGKLSLFSIANVVEVHTVRNGEHSSLEMSTAAILEHLRVHPAAPYKPKPLPVSALADDVTHGTKIVLRDMKKRLGRTGSALRTRLARRFTILGDPMNFHLYVGADEVTVGDRDYFHKLQYLWTFDEPDAATNFAAQARNAETRTLPPVQLQPLDDDDEVLDGTDPFTVSGWIGTAASTTALKEPSTGDNLNKIGLLLRGKLAHEDLMEEFNENGMYASYLIGEIHADFLDDDDELDIATSSRQRIVEDDPRYRALIRWLRSTVSKIGGEWLKRRDASGRDRALDNALIAEWFKTLGKDQRRKAERLFGKINQLTIDNDVERAALFTQAVLGFETLRYRDNLDALDDLDPEDFRRLSGLFGDITDIQATLYRRIVRQRLEVIQKLRDHVDANDLERILQEHLYENLWLLDPSWERAADHSMEERISTLFDDVDAGLPDEILRSRIDLRYRRTSGKHVIVELKRADVRTDALTLIRQIDKYRTAVRHYLTDVRRQAEPLEVVCVLGSYPATWSDPGVRNEDESMLAAKGARVVLYENLLREAEDSYREYLDADQAAGRVQTLIEGLARTASGDEEANGV